MTFATCLILAVHSLYSLFLKAHFHVAKPNHVAVFNLSRFAVSDAAAVNISAVCRSGVGDEQRAFAVHQQRGMNFRNAGVVQRQIVIGTRPTFNRLPPGLKINGTSRCRCAALPAQSPRMSGIGGAPFGIRGSTSRSFRFICLLELFFKLAKGRIDGDAGGENIDFGFDLHLGQRAIAMIVDVIDRGGENFVFEILKDFRRRFRVRAPFDFKFQMMRGDAAFAAFVAHALIDQFLHPLD